MRLYLPLYTVITVIAVSLSNFSCGDLPENPTLNPDNAKIGLFVDNNGIIEYGTSKEIGIGIIHCRHFDSVKITISCKNYDTAFAVDTGLYKDTIRFRPLFTTEGPCTVYAHATMQDPDLKDRVEALPLHVLPEKPGIHFITMPNRYFTHAGRTDTLIYVTKGTGGVASQSVKYACSPVPEADDGEFTINNTADNDTLRLIISPSGADTFTVTISASATSGSNTQVQDLAVTGIRVFESFVPTAIGIPPALDSDVTDTLLFTIDNSGRPDRLTLQFVSSNMSDASTAKSLESGPDSLMVAVVPEYADTVTFGIAVSNGVLCDTVWYSIPCGTAEFIDTIPPEITLSTGPKDNDRVRTADGKYSFIITDRSDVGSVYWMLNGSVAETLQVAKDSMYELSYSLKTYGANRIALYAQDKSDAKNRDSVELTLVYNTAPGTVALSAPKDNAVDVDTAPSFSWSGGDDADGDSVRYWVIYGANTESLNLRTNDTKDKSIVLAADEKLASAAVYYWRVVAMSSGSFTDTVRSDIRSFTTAGVMESPVCTLTFESNGGGAVPEQTIKTGDYAKEPSPPPTKDDSEFGGWFTTSSMATEFDFTGTPIIANRTVYAKWIPVYKVTYNKNGAESGSVPVDGNKYRNGVAVQIQGNIGGLSRSGYNFSGWNTKEDSSGIDRIPGETFVMASANVVLYAKWKKMSCTVTFDGQGATAPPQPASLNVKVSSAAGSLPTAPSKIGYVFDSWWTAKKGTGTQFTATTVVTESITVFAKWIIKDIDNNIYTDVTIGTQVWMAENLKVTKYNDGTALPDGAYSYPDSNAINKEKYGILYNQALLFEDPQFNIKDPQLIAPPGWHIPSETEWLTLQNYLIANGYNYDGTSAGNKIGKSMASTTDWDYSNVAGNVGNNAITNDKSGFNAKPAGYHYNFTRTYFTGFGQFTYWWSSTDVENETVKIFFILNYDLASFDKGVPFPYQACSIRLIHD